MSDVGSAGAATPAAVDPTRAELVGRALASWRRKLTDLSRRNALLFLRPSLPGILNLSAAEPEIIARLLAGTGSVDARCVWAEDEHSQIRERLRSIARRAQANLEEKGLDTLALALGSATWPADDGGRPTDAPVLLVPIKLTSKGSSQFELQRSGLPQINPVLAHALGERCGIDLAAACAGLLPDEDQDESGVDLAELFARIGQSAGAVGGFAISSRAILGNFAFQKMAMVRDLEENASAYAASDVIAAISGDAKAGAMLSPKGREIEKRDLDAVAPENEFLVLDADSSQMCAIANVTAGQHAVIHGPPGTGKSQTIANLIATLAATGKRVLFVAEKRVALEVVQRRLAEAGLGHLALDLHGANVSPAKALQQVGTALNQVRASAPVECAEAHSRFQERRRRLNAHVYRLAQAREPTGMSVFEMRGKLLGLPRSVRSQTRWRGDALLRLTRDAAREAEDALKEAAGMATLFLSTDPTPWCGANLVDGSAVANAIDLVGRLRQIVEASLFAPLAAIAQAASLPMPATIGGVRALLDLLNAVQDTLAAYGPEIYQLDLTGIQGELARGESSRLAALWSWLTRRPFRRARASVLKCRRAGRAPIAELVAEITRAQRQLELWRAAGGESSPRAVPEPVLRQPHEFLGLLLFLQAMLPNQDLERSSPDDLLRLLGRLASEAEIAYRLPKLAQLRATLTQLGADPLIAEIAREQPSPELWPATYRYAWLSSALDLACQRDPEIRSFVGASHDGYVAEFAHLDRERLRLASARVRRAHAEHAIAAMNAHPEQELKIKREAAKFRRRLPLRKIFAEAADVLTAVCPCCMASPLSVSQLMDGRPYFDFVIFDEASQILPEDAAPALLRGRMAVVAGDAHQLPPTTFFAPADDLADDTDPGAAEGFGSLLELMQPLVPARYLDWHYRSRDEALIRFSNHHIYDDRLVTFPGPGGPPAVQFQLSEQPPGLEGEEESCSAEVNKVVEIVARHAREKPTESLGVITMGIRHMERIQAALDRELDSHPELAEFFSTERPEPCFVKNLERVQGDEREAIIVSVGYGKGPAGNLPLRFGPLLSASGRRRLNVAITRARRSVTVVASFRHTDIDLSRLRPGSGVALLRDYLEYAESGGRSLGAHITANIPLNDFEQDIFDTLTACGMKLVPQLGASGYRIDIAVLHPNEPGRFVLAIECDGASYHSAYTARDRDRLRQQQLESLGWRFHRIWSTDWFLRRAEETKRAMEAYAAAVRLADGASGEARGAPRVPDASQQPEIRPQPRNFPERPSITDYSDGELLDYVTQLCSDGRLRTDDEIVGEMTRALGFRRRGGRIESRLRAAVARWRAAQPSKKIL